jgi:hypothetical protein
MLQFGSQSIINLNNGNVKYNKLNHKSNGTDLLIS